MSAEPLAASQAIWDELMEHIPASHALRVGMRYPAIVLDVYRWGLTLYFDLTRLAPGRSPRISAHLLFERTLLSEVARQLGENDRVEVVLIAVGNHGNTEASLPADSAWLTWNDETVRRLARHIRGSGETHLMPVLADALEDAGCTDAALLDHCREPGDPGAWSWVAELLATQQ